MGNEHSLMSGLTLDEKAVEVTDFWIHHSATLFSDNASSLTVFISEPFVVGTLWSVQTPLEKFAKNLMVHRHPCILKYISSWSKNSKFYLATEDVKPLSQVLYSQNTLQICVGLHSILNTLCFLHENALTSHNNVCITSIYVTKDGGWKLGGLEFLCKYKDLTLDYLNKTRSYRYNKAVDPNEEKIFSNKNRFDLIDSYAFSVLVTEVLHLKNDEEVSTLTEFCNFCKNDVQQVNMTKRPHLKTIAEHQFFSQEFILIHSFLTELPLKSDTEKATFFASLTDKLREFNEAIVAGQLGGLLLSRMVLLDKIAQKELLPFIFSLDQDNDLCESGLFSLETFKTYLRPRLLDMFCIRDAQIRLILLNHFFRYMKCFTKEELQEKILPELLVGIKDTNDHLVAVTLRILADIVPILGAATVIGGKRGKLFNDGLPTLYSSGKERRHSKQSQDLAPESDSSMHIPPLFSNALSSNSSAAEVSPILELPERPSPDGEEDETLSDIVQSVEEDLDNWEDWDVNEANASTNVENSLDSHTETVENPVFSENTSTELDSQNVPENKNRDGGRTDLELDPIGQLQKNKILPDIDELDIKNKKNNHPFNSDEVNFFQDMEPVIESSNKFLVFSDNNNDSEVAPKINKKLEFIVNDDSQVEGWGDDDWD